MKEELLNGLTEEQVAKVKACKSQEEILKVAKEEGIELTDEQLEAVSGGCGTESPPLQCPGCGSTDLFHTPMRAFHEGKYSCNNCGRVSKKSEAQTANPS